MPANIRTTASCIRRTSLNGLWQLFGTGPAGEHIEAAAHVPGVVHWDLQRARITGDPFDADVEQSVSWIAGHEWTYSLTFRASRKTVSARNVELVFQGLDTFAKITLNGKILGETDNMFVPYRFDVKDVLTLGENVLAVRFLSPVEEGLRLHRKHESVKLYEGHDNPRAYVRKAQYSYGWDWGPKITTSGIWRDVYIESWDTARIESVYWQTLKASAEKARVAVTVECVGSTRATATARLSVGGNVHEIPLRRRKLKERTVLTGDLEIAQPLLWWPAGQGPQNLYKAQVSLFFAGDMLDTHECDFGIRTVELKREKDDEGESFIFVVNDREVFCKGANWIPADIYLPRITDGDYEAWVRMAADANMNMLRVWGGGIYEPDAFYNACNRLGVMVWQDFLFACAMYPEDEWFVKNVEREAACAVKALRNHPSLVIWCGNNENHWASHSWWPGDAFGGKTIYNKTLPAVTRRHDPTRPYWPGSPFGGKDPNSQHKGDRHSWEVWSGWQDSTMYLKDNGRFVSEFGFQGAPPVESVAHFGPLDTIHPQHPLFERHNKQVEGGSRLARFLATSFRMPRDLAEYIHLTQMVQAEAIKTGVLHWRSRMMQTSGALYWQLNDCWPVVSWSAVDFARRPKALYYYSRRFFAPVAVRVAPFSEGVFAWVINDSPEFVSGEIVLQAMTFAGEEVGCVREYAEIGPGGVHRMGPFSSEMLGVTDLSQVFVVATLAGTDGRSVRDTAFFLRPKHLALGAPSLDWEISASEGVLKAAISAEKFAYGVFLDLPGTGARFSDNFLTLLPGETVEIDIAGSHLSAAVASKKLITAWVSGGL